MVALVKVRSRMWRAELLSAREGENKNKLAQIHKSRTLVFVNHDYCQGWIISHQTVIRQKASKLKNHFSDAKL